MKKILSFILAFTLLISLYGCTKSPADTPSQTAIDSEAENVDKSDQFAGVTIRISDPRAPQGTYICDPEPEDKNAVGRYTYSGIFEYETLAAKTGMNIEVSGFTMDDRTMKILAGDGDVDIYLFFHHDAKLMKDQGICEPIQSDVIGDFVSKTFMPLQDGSKDDNGNIVMMPVEYAIHALFAPKKAVEELNIKAEDIEYYKDFLEFLKNYKGSRTSYGAGTNLFYLLEQQYHYFHCDLENGVFDYYDDEFVKMYEALLGTWTNGYDEKTGELVSSDPWYYKGLGYDKKSVDDNLFTLTALNGLLGVSKTGWEDTDSEMIKKAGEIFDNFVSFPVPKFDETVDKNTLSVASYAYINPYSENKEAALWALEAMAQNYMDIIGCNCAYLIFSDTEMYPEWFETESQLFKDYVAMSDNSVAVYHDNICSLIDIEYTRKIRTLEDALKERTRVVNIMLNE